MDGIRQWTGVTIYGLYSGTKYYFMVSAVKNDIESKYGSVVEAITDTMTFSVLYLVAEDGTYLGKLTTNKYHTESIFNQWGEFGSNFGMYSIWNDFGRYGGKFSLYSPFNDFASMPPYIVTIDGTTVGRLTTNWTIPGAISPYEIYGILLGLGL